jgi:hypothetical protein
MHRHSATQRTSTAFWAVFGSKRWVAMVDAGNDRGAQTGLKIRASQSAGGGEGLGALPRSCWHMRARFN